MRVIDSLVHITEDGSWFGTKHDASLERLLREMDEVGVAHAVLVAVTGHASNQFVKQTCRESSGRLLPVAMLDPSAHNSGAEAADEAIRLFEDGSFVGLKLHPRLCGYQPLDARCLEVLEAVSSLEPSIPVWLDTLLYAPGVELPMEPVHLLHTLVNRFPSVPFILLHGAGADVLRLADAVRGCPNAWLDVSYTLSRFKGTTVWNDLKFLMECFERRMIFGSDFPEVSLPRAVNGLQALASGCGDGVLEAVGGGNLKAVLEESGYEWF